MAWTSVKEIIISFLEELKKALKEYLAKQEADLKVRLKKILILSIAGAVLMALAISLAGSAALFILIGSLRYLETFLPSWQAWLIIGATAAIAAAALFIALYLLIRSQLSTSKTDKQEQELTPKQGTESPQTNA
jgi:integral membrane sensor domain MASE1